MLLKIWAFPKVLWKTKHCWIKKTDPTLCIECHYFCKPFVGLCTCFLFCIPPFQWSPKKCREIHFSLLSYSTEGNGTVQKKWVCLWVSLPFNSVSCNFGLMFSIQKTLNVDDEQVFLLHYNCFQEERIWKKIEKASRIPKLRRQTEQLHSKTPKWSISLEKNVIYGITRTMKL